MCENKEDCASCWEMTQCSKWFCTHHLTAPWTFHSKTHPLTCRRGETRKSMTAHSIISQLTKQVLPLFPLEEKEHHLGLHNVHYVADYWDLHFITKTIQLEKGLQNEKGKGQSHRLCAFIKHQHQKGCQCSGIKDPFKGTYNLESGFSIKMSYKDIWMSICQM